MNADDTGSAAQQQLICGAVSAMPLLYMILVAVLKSAGVVGADGLVGLDQTLVGTISIALIAAGVLSSLSSIVLKKISRASLTRDKQETPEIRFKSTLMAMAVAESGAAIGLVLMLLTGNLLYGGLLCGLSFALCCFHFPSRYWLEHGDMAR